MKYLRSSGLISKIIKYAENGGSVIGICGGYQMLCKLLSTTHIILKQGQYRRAWAYKMCQNIFEKTKVTTQVSGVFENI